MAGETGMLAQLDLDRRAYRFELSEDRVAQEPPEARGGERSDVRLLVAYRDRDLVEHRRFRELSNYLRSDDVFVVNNARVVPSILRGTDRDGDPVVAQIFSPIEDGTWHCMTVPERACFRGATFSFAGGKATGTLLGEEDEHVWRLALEPADMNILESIGDFLYPWYLKRPPDRPEYYQTAYASCGGATGLPSAGRHLTREMLAGLEAFGVAIVQVTLDIAVRWTYEGLCKNFWEIARPSATAQEPPYMFEALYGPPRPERYSVSRAAADAINERRRRGGRIVVCGTSALRTLETVADDAGRVYPGSGWTGILICPGHEFRACDAFLTNFHMPMSTELLLTAAFLGDRDKLLDIYQRQVLSRGYAFHEFGDSMLITGEAQRRARRRPEPVPDLAGEDPRRGLTGG